MLAKIASYSKVHATNRMALIRFETSSPGRKQHGMVNFAFYQN
jgi:hypothetical protein